MGKETGIAWTDSTFNSWFGCTKVGPACDSCYAEAVDKRSGGDHWGTGAPRRLLSERARNEPFRWQKKAPEFFAKHGRRQRVFTLSMGDLFDNEVPDDWRAAHMAIMESTPDLEWQICTKRIGNLPKMVPQMTGANLPGWTLGFWPRNVGVLVTIVTQAEADRDLPKLLRLKAAYAIPWVGVSYEPAQEMVHFSRYLGTNGVVDYGASLDWIIFGGKSGPQWNDRPFDVEWGREVARKCDLTNTAFFFKQVAGFRPTVEQIPADLLIRQFPKGH